MPDIRDVLKGLSEDDRALYSEIRTSMRRAYLYAHSKTLPIDQYEATDDAFLDLIDIKIAMLFDRAGIFDHSKGSLDVDKAMVVTKEVHDSFEGAATRMLRNGGDAVAAQAWPTKGN